MELTGILFLVLVVLGLALFIFFAVKAFSGWGVLYTVTLSFLLIFTILFLYLSANVAQRRIAWVKVHDTLKKEAQTLTAQLEVLKFGEMNRPTSDLNSLLPLVNELSRLTVDRGRVWRNANVTEFKPDSVRLTMAPNAPPAPMPGGVAPAVKPLVNGDLPAELLVYAFGERPGADGKSVASVYLGEFFVAESQGGNAVLRPLQPLLPQQIAAASSGQFPTWSVFELMPLDSHDAFAVIGSKRSNEAEFGRMDPEAISQLFGIPLDLVERYEKDPSSFKDGPELRKAQLLRSYLRDGTRAPENEIAENVWLRIEFLKEHTIDVDSKEERNASDGGYFDSSGRTVDARLKRPSDKGPVPFTAGQQVVFAKKPAEELIASGVAKLIEPIFVRPVNDYIVGFREARSRQIRAIQDADLVRREIAQGEATNKLGQEQIVNRQAERQLLDADLAQYTKERDVIAAEAARLEAKVAEVKSELSRLYRSSQEQYDRLVKRQQQLKQAIP
jgi:hypothetical protein